MGGAAIAVGGGGAAWQAQRGQRGTGMGAAEGKVERVGRGNDGSGVAGRREDLEAAPKKHPKNWRNCAPPMLSVAIVDTPVAKKGVG